MKGMLYFLWPALALRSIAHVAEASAWKFRAAGVPAAASGLVIGWISLGPPAL